MWAAKCCIHGRLPCATWNNESDGGLSGIDARRRAMTAAAPTCAAAVLMRSKYLWVIWLGIKSGQSSLKGSVRMINLILLLLSGLVMAIRAEKGVRPLIFGSSSFTACRIPSSFIHGCWIDCLFSPMNDKAALGPTGWEREVAGGADTAHFHLYARWISPSCLASLEVGFLHYLLDNHQHFNMVNQTVTVI